MEIKDSQAIAGLNFQSSPSQVKKGQLTWALNAVTENSNGDAISYQNEEGNSFCVEFPEGFRVVGGRQIEDFLFFLLSDESTSKVVTVKDCVVTTLFTATCLNLSKLRPVHKIVYKKTAKTLEVYWTDGTQRRWMDLKNLPYKEVDSSNCDNALTTDIDCNKMLVQPNFSIPTIDYVDIGAGDLTEGTYQFAVQYANSLGDGYTSYYSITNPISIVDTLQEGQDFKASTGKSVSFQIKDIDDTGIFDYINIAVIQTVNNIPTPYLVETKKIEKKTLSYTYTGENKSPIQITVEDIFEKFPIYDKADSLFSVQDVLGWVGVSTSEKINYQQIANKIKLQWQSYKVPIAKAYKDGLTTANYKTYFRDEIYALDLVLFNANGKQTDRFHIPNREHTAKDIEIIKNADAAITTSVCDGEKEISPFRYQIYNTATNIGKSSNYNTTECYEGEFEYGDFAYWESTDTYPCDQAIWGDLAGKPIRHHKFPDTSISAHHDKENVYPIGIKVDVDQIREIIRNSSLTEDQKRDIVGFKIVRGNRASHKSIAAKGLIYNVGKYTKDNKTYFYPNYPFNDLRKDPFLSTQKTKDDSGYNSDLQLDGFSSEDSRKRFTFHSPDTHFYQNTLGTILKIESLEVGNSEGHFVQTKNHSKYKFLSTGSYVTVLGAAVVVGIISNTVGLADTIFAGTAAFAAYDTIINIIEKTLPRINFAYQFNSLGDYTESLPVKEGNIVRNLDIAKYILPGYTSAGDTHSINNYQRESSVYLRTTSPLANPEVEDRSRWTLGEVDCDVSTIQNRPISSYYASIKKDIPNLYSTIHSYESIDTGFYQPINVYGDERVGVKTVFGGDCFINKFGLKRKLPFFLDNRVSKEGTNIFPDDSDIFYDELSNVAYSTYWISTDYKQDQQGDGGNIFQRIFSTVKQFFGVKINNFDCRRDKFFYQNGKFYLFAYGISYFFVESEVNTDLRRAYNNKEGNFFPHVGEDIPDDWLQESTTSIQNDNTYFYNKTFSKQNKENLFTSFLESDDTFTYYPNKAIYSDQHTDQTNYKKNNWLIYRGASYFDFPQNYGRLISLDGVQSNAVLARFEDKALLYNTMLTINTSSPKAVYLGNDSLFKSSPPLDFAETDLGWAGSQHQFISKSENGAVFVDAKRGEIFLLQGTRIEPLSGDKYNISQWLIKNLPFKITNYFPTYPTDNHFNGVGITGVYDSKYDRLILTKLDYTPLDPAIKYSNNKFTINETEIDITDPLYFNNESFTISFSFKLGCWVSLHSYIPNYYVGSTNSFYCGTDSLCKFPSQGIFNTYFGKIEPYIIEYPLADQKDTILQSITDYTKSFQYTGGNKVSSSKYFNKVIISNPEQTTGIRNLIEKPRNRPAEYLKFPKYHPDSIDILYTKSGSTFHYNHLWNVVKDPSQPIFLPEIDNQLNQDNLDYSNKSFQKHPIRNMESKVRHILDDKKDVQLISQFILSKEQISYK